MAINPGTSLNSVPSSLQQALSTNYLDLASEAGKGWAQQYVPDLMEQEAEVFGPRTISGFLAQVGAEESMTADQVIWSEQGRLHLSYKGKLKLIQLLKYNQILMVIIKILLMVFLVLVIHQLDTVLELMILFLLLIAMVLKSV